MTAVLSFFAAFIFSLSLSAAPSNQSYFFKTEDTDETLLRPVKPMPAIKFVEVTNFYDGGPFNARRTEFHYNSLGRFTRGVTRKIDLLAAAYRQRFPAGKSCGAALSGQAMGQLFLNMIISGGLHQPFENQALGDMQARKYISPDQREQYKPDSFWDQPEGRVQLEMVSWMTTKEVLDVFGGKIPWARVAEVEGPAGLREKDLRKAVDRGDTRFRLKIRRATLYLVAGQYYSSVEATGEIRFQKLPWQKEDKITDKYDIGRMGVPGAQPFAWELGRASQIRGLEGEAVELASFAAIIALHQTFSQNVVGWRYGFPPDEAHFYIHSLKNSNTALYRELLAASPVPEVSEPKDTLMTVTLANLVEHLQAFEKFENYREPLEMGLEPSIRNYLALLSTMEMARQAKRLDGDLYLQGRRINNNGPFIVRYSPSQTIKTLDVRTAAWTGPDKEWAMRVLKDLNPLDGNRNYGDPTEDFVTDTVKVLGREANHLSGFDPHAAQADPLYVAKVLLIWGHTLNWTLVEGRPFLIVAKHPTLLEQLKELGLSPTKIESGLHYFLLQQAEFNQVASKQPALQKLIEEQGKFYADLGWRQVRLLRDLIGF